jgi:hypothetical protein
MNKDIESYLIHCYLYYALNSPVISDTEFDALCKKLLDSGAEHELVSKSDLRAGTGYSIKEYPAEIIEKAEALLKKAPAPAPTVEEEKPIAFTGHPLETYLLLGLYIDFGYARQRDKQKEVQKELRRRWSLGMHKSEFKAYFTNWGFGPARFGLEEAK